jgi:flagellar biosynthetic protein FliO
MDVAQQFLAVVIILGLLFALLWVAKKKGWAQVRMRARAGVSKRLEVIDQLALTPNHSIHLIRLADRTLLVGLSPNGCNLLETMPAQPSQIGEAQA